MVTKPSGLVVQRIRSARRLAEPELPLSFFGRWQEKLTLRTKTLTPPLPIKPIRAKEIVAIRTRLAVSQAVFARLLNVPKVTEISWEKGRRKPTGAALRLLDLVRKKPTILQEA